MGPAQSLSAGRVGDECLPVARPDRPVPSSTSWFPRARVIPTLADDGAAVAGPGSACTPSPFETASGPTAEVRPRAHQQPMRQGVSFEPVDYVPGAKVSADETNSPCSPRRSGLDAAFRAIRCGDGVDTSNNPAPGFVEPPWRRVRSWSRY